MAGASGEIGIPDAAVRALAAGCDLLCIGTENTDAQLGEIEAALAAAVVGRAPRRRHASPTRSRGSAALAAGGRRRRRDRRGPSPSRASTLDRTIAAFDIAPARGRARRRTRSCTRDRREHRRRRLRRGGRPRREPRRAGAARGRRRCPSGRPQLVLIGKDNHRRAGRARSSTPPGARDPRTRRRRHGLAVRRPRATPTSPPSARPGTWARRC